MLDSQQNQGAVEDQFGSMEFYLSTLYLGLVCLLAGFFSIKEGGGSDFGETLLVVGLLIFSTAEIYFLVLLYKVWRFVIAESINAGLVASIESPGRAVGFLFIPFYNFYWVFQSFGKLPGDLNALARAKGSDKMVPEALGIALALFSILGIIPGVGYVIMFMRGAIMQPVFIKKSIDICKGIEKRGGS